MIRYRPSPPNYSSIAKATWPWEPEYVPFVPVTNQLLTTTSNSLRTNGPTCKAAE